MWKWVPPRWLERIWWRTQKCSDSDNVDKNRESFLPNCDLHIRKANDGKMFKELWCKKINCNTKISMMKWVLSLLITASLVPHARSEYCPYGYFLLWEDCFRSNCIDFYIWGPDEYTGKLEIPVTEDHPGLTCYYIDQLPMDWEPICPDENGEELFPIAVRHTCGNSIDRLTSGTNPLCFPDDDDEAGSQDLFVRMNRVCVAYSNQDQVFTCYEISPETNMTSYFTNYLEAVESFEGCDLVPREESSIYIQTPGSDGGWSSTYESFDFSMYLGLNISNDGEGNSTLSPDDPIQKGAYAMQIWLTLTPTPSPTPAPSASSPNRMSDIVITRLAIGLSMFGSFHYTMG